jgi:hypothetical protein
LTLQELTVLSIAQSLYINELKVQYYVAPSVEKGKLPDALTELVLG